MGIIWVYITIKILLYIMMNVVQIKLDMMYMIILQIIVQMNTMII
jgi:hypothetical protein